MTAAPLTASSSEASRRWPTRTQRARARPLPPTSAPAAHRSPAHRRRRRTPSRTRRPHWPPRRAHGAARRSPRRRRRRAPRAAPSHAPRTVSGPIGKIDAQVLARLRALHEHAARPGGLAAAPPPREAPQHRVGPLRALDRHDPPASNDRLADVVGTQPVHDVAAQLDIGKVRRRGCDPPQAAPPDQDLGRDLRRADDCEALRLEEADDTAQHAVVPAGANEPEDRGHGAQEPQVGPQPQQVRRRTPPMMMSSLTPPRRGTPEDAAHRAPVHGPVGKRRERGLPSPAIPTRNTSLPRATASSAISRGRLPPPARMPTGARRILHHELTPRAARAPCTARACRRRG